MILTMVKYLWFHARFLSMSPECGAAESESRAGLESVGVDRFGLESKAGAGVGKIWPTPTPARSHRLTPGGRI